MNELVATVGLPGSGKSTWAKSQTGYKRVNRDDLRAMYDPIWTPKSEILITQIRDTAIKLALTHGHNVISDDTNLDPKVQNHLRELATAHNAGFRIQDFREVPLDECIRRDAARERRVGPDVIKNMYYKWLFKKIDPPAHDPYLPNALICDLDGTLALFEGKRNPYDASKCDETDEPNYTVLRLINLLRQAHINSKILFVSGRMEKYRDSTLRFLSNKCFINVAGHNYKLWMRKDRDNRSDVIVKQEIYEEHIAGEYNVEFIVDDRPKVVRFWQSLGYTVFNVGNGVEF
jgi:predicted kinase